MPLQQEIVSPAGPLQPIVPVTLNPIGALDGRRIVVLDNGKPGARLLAQLAIEHLATERSFASVRYFRKDNPATGARPALLDEVAAAADLVLTGTGD